MTKHLDFSKRTAESAESLQKCVSNDCVISRRRLLVSLATLSAGATLAGKLMAGFAPLFLGTQPGRIDVHHHIMPPQYLSFARERVIAAAGATRDVSVLMDWTPARAIEEMDKNGVATGITSLGLPGIWFGSPTASRALARSCNEYAARMAGDYPGRFGTFAALPMPDQEGSLREIEHSLDTLKVDGFALLTNYGDKWTGDISFYPVLEELNRRKAVVHVHPAAANCCVNLIPGVPPGVEEFLFDTARSIMSLMIGGSFIRYPDIRFIFSHAGGAMPAVASRMDSFFKSHKELSDRVPNGVPFELNKLRFDIASSVNRSTMAALMNLVPTSQLLFGSDYPYVQMSATANGLDSFGLSVSDTHSINRENALPLFPRLKP
jgi:predicted TIM-barrel fold metal-dependent hydrolase